VGGELGIISGIVEGEKEGGTVAIGDRGVGSSSRVGDVGVCRESADVLSWGCGGGGDEQCMDDEG
jgi:hypothetical protein